MQKIAICGIGQRFENYFIKETFLKAGLKEHNIKIAGFLDGNVKKIGSEIVYEGTKFKIVAKDKWKSLGADRIFIMSRKYYDDIRKDLLSYGCEEDNIYPLEYLQAMCLNDLYPTSLFKGKNGIEIGGPSWIFLNIYDLCNTCDGVNYSRETAWWKQGGSTDYSYNGKTLGKVHIADATDLRILENDRYDFVISSNSLEHIANPIKALGEYYRILVQKGIIVTVVPMKERMFDHNRNFTTFEHLLDDYKKDVKEEDLSHLPEILQCHDYDMDAACGGKEAFELRAQSNYENRCLHHHVFDKACLRKLYGYFNLEIICLEQIFDNYYIAGRKK